VSPRKRSAASVKDVMSSHLFHLDKNASLPDTLAFFKKHRSGAYPVTYRKKLMGFVTEWDIVRQIRGRTGMRAGDIMIRKPIVADVKYSIADVSKMLTLGGFRRLPVVDKGVLVGIVSPRDVINYLIENNLADKLPKQKDSVKTVMEKKVTTIHPSEDVFEVVKIMVGKKIGGLAVMEDHDFVGIITERDIVDISEF
jgi:predicted transcriptional regulator